MTTELPCQILTPDEVHSPIGTLEFLGGVPIGDRKETVLVR